MNKFRKDYKKSKKKTYKKIKKLGKEKIRGLRFLIVGITLILSSLIYSISQQVRLSFNTQPTQTIEYNSSPPQTIYIPRYKVSVDISLARIFNGVWSIDEQNANYLVSSARPGDQGNIVIYGHNSIEIFGSLRWTYVGDEIIITNADGDEFKYTVAKIEEVDPSDIQWVSSKDTETLTLYTCAGFLNRKRHIVVAKPQN